MKNWLVLISMLSLCACLDEPENAEEPVFDSDSGTVATCEDCHIAMPPPTAPHNDVHSFFTCNNANCHGDMVNAEGTLASGDDERHTNSTMDATCASCHESGVSPDTDKENNFTCTACHALPPDDDPHNEIHAGYGFACNNENCHGAMVSEDGTEILDDTKHMDDATEATCTNCHGDVTGCTACHQTPPAGSPHNDGNHIIFSCNNVDCHGTMVSEDGTEILDDSKHMDGQSEIEDLSCGDISVCHGK